MPSCKINTNRLRGYKIKLYPTDDQKKSIKENIDVFRAVYNLGLEIELKEYDESKKYINYYSMCKIVSDLRNNNPDYNWLKSVTIGTIRQALLNLDHAFKYYFKRIFDKPRFKSKKTCNKIFMTRSERTYIYDNYIGIPGIGHIYAKSHPIPIGIRVYSTSVLFDGYDYWFCCQIERDMIDMSDTDVYDTIGVDVGIRNLITTSDGEYYHFSDTSKYQKRLKRQQRRLSKLYNKYLTESKRTRIKYEDIPKSKNMQKKLQSQHKTYQKIKNKRHNDIHVATKRIVEKNPSCIVIETIKVSKITEIQWMHKYAPQMMFHEIHRQIQYKAADRGIPVIKADERYPSSQICSRCGNIRKIYHSKYHCPICGLNIDRDLNAAINLRNLVYQNNYIEVA